MHSKWQSKRIVTKITFSKVAVNALLSQAKYIFELTLDENKADAYLDDMKDYLTAVLTNHSMIGRPAPELGLEIRKLVYRRYTVLYRITDTQIEILTLYKENLPNI